MLWFEISVIIICIGICVFCKVAMKNKGGK